jgi:hypothetical protein
MHGFLIPRRFNFLFINPLDQAASFRLQAAGNTKVQTDEVQVLR